MYVCMYVCICVCICMYVVDAIYLIKIHFFSEYVRRKICYAGNYSRNFVSNNRSCSVPAYWETMRCRGKERGREREREGERDYGGK